jgi:Putative auto-transporter adhesin, head GIN domain
MKKSIFVILFVIIIMACSKPSQCIESTGNIISKEFTMPNFDKIKVFRGISLVISQGNVQKIEVKTGENLIDDIEIKVEDGTLILKDNTTCNWVRDYGQTTVYVTTPTLTEVICKTEKSISSNGVLTFPILRLVSVDLTEGGAVGDFDFQIDNNQLFIGSNNASNFYISGKTNDFEAGFYEGNGRIESANLIAKNINVFHRGSNDMVLNPQIKMTGKIVSTGNIYCKNPNVINEVIELFQGRVLF